MFFYQRDELQQLATQFIINRIPGMKDLAHKKTTGSFLNKFHEYFPEVFDFFPRTFLFPEEFEEFKAIFSKTEEKLFIAKPSAGGHGDGIFLVSKLTDLTNSPQYKQNDEMVIQTYLDKPLLIGNKKFDLRLYVLISSIDPLIVYLNEEGLARFCTEEYQKPTNQNIKNSFMHLTNYTLNRTSPNFIFYSYSEELTQDHNGTKRSLTSL